MACQAVEVRMTPKTDSLNHRISDSYKQLTQAATEVNAVSVEKLPDLFESLVKEADAATRQIRTKTQRAQALATALTDPAPAAPAAEPAPAKKPEPFPMTKLRF